MAPLLFLTLPLLSFAYTPEELQERFQALKSAQAESTLADSELPPCEGLDRISAEVLKHEPPASCPKARKLYEVTEKFDLSLRDNCRNFNRWMADTLRDRESLRDLPEDDQAKIKQKLRNFREAVEEKFEQLPDHDYTVDPKWTGEGENGGQGEYARMECSLPVELDYQLVHRENSLLGKNYGFADSTLNQILENDHPQEAADEYLRLLDEGWKALNEP